MLLILPTFLQRHLDRTPICLLNISVTLDIWNTSRKFRPFWKRLQRHPLWVALDQVQRVPPCRSLIDKRLRIEKKVTPYALEQSLPIRGKSLRGISIKLEVFGSSEFLGYRVNKRRTGQLPNQGMFSVSATKQDNSGRYWKKIQSRLGSGLDNQDQLYGWLRSVKMSGMPVV